MRPIHLILFYLICTAFLSTVKTQWVQQNSNTIKDIHALYCIDSNNCFASSFDISMNTDSQILGTTDGGLNWTVIALLNAFAANSLHFFNSNTGVVAGGLYATQPPILYRTTNGGQSWTNISFISHLGSIISIEFLNSGLGYAITSSGIFNSTNGGLNWAYVSSFPENSRANEFDFINSNTGWIACDSGKLYKTTNAGQNWFSLLTNTFSTMSDICFINELTGYSSGALGTVIKTVNGGLDWSSLVSGTVEGLNTVFFVNDLTGFAGGSTGLIIRTINGGMSWELSSSGVNSEIFDILFLNQNIGYANGKNGLILKTTTGGIIGIEPFSSDIPKTYELYQNYPNPFNPSTNIRFAVSRAAYVKLSVYDMLGRELEILVSENLKPATYEVKWNAGKYSSGIYFYRLTTDDFQQVKKMSVIK
jgi:photosystem II stability/assembly factor-like uncharacterized protein